MAERRGTEVVLRPKRQVTLPREICERLGVKTGDVLELMVEDSSLIAKPRKTRSLEALKEIRRIFQQSGIAEKELQQEGKKVRREIIQERDAEKR